VVELLNQRPVTEAIRNRDSDGDIHGAERSLYRTDPLIGVPQALHQGAAASDGDRPPLVMSVIRGE